MSHSDRDGGFTLVEVSVAMVLIGLMAALAVAGYRQWAESNAHVGTARELQTVMRQAQQQAVTEGRATCVWLDVSTNTYTVYRGACEASTKQRLVGPYRTESTDVKLAAPSFTDATGTGAGVTFYARGTASAGQVSVTRSGSDKVYQVLVEGLTGRVSMA